MRYLLLCYLLASQSFSVFAAVEARVFASAEQEQAYTQLIAELRCLVCQNQTIADSNADLAKDLRQQVYAQLQQGKSNQDIIDFMTQRYGDFVLYRPPFKAKTGLLWLGPIVFLIVGLIVWWHLTRHRKQQTSVADSERTEKARTLLEQGEKL